jgi:dolichol-phosphate mannosyltransferase
MAPHNDVTIVIPAKNEAANIEQTVRRAMQFAQRVLLVDGHSVDGTPDIAAAAGAQVVYDRGRGKGDAIAVAASHVTTPITVFMDADGSHDAADVPRLIEPIIAGVADHVSGSRLIGGSSELHGGFDEFFRLAGAAFITACVNRRYGVTLSDTQNGFRAIRTTLLRELDLREPTTTIEQEMIAKTLALGYRLAEVPCHEHKRLHGHSHIVVWRAAPRYAWSLVRNLCRRRVSPERTVERFAPSAARHKRA